MNTGPCRTLADAIASHPPREEALALAARLAREVAALHAAGRVHGKLAPGDIEIADDGNVRLGTAGAAAPPVDVTAPEVLRGRRTRRAADVFAAAALAHALLAGRSPFAAGERLETVRRVLHDEPAPVGGLPARVEAGLARALAKAPWRRGSARTLAEALARGLPAGTNPISTAATTPTATSTATSTNATSSSMAPPRRRVVPLLAAAGGLALLAAYAFVPESDASLAAEVSTLVRQGELARARTLLDAAGRRRPASPTVEKLHGDLACARGAGIECLRRYRAALAARPELREDRSLRENVRGLLAPAASCSERRAAAELLAVLRDRDALPALLAARRSGGLFRSLCTGDSIERAIEVTRAAAQ